MTPLETLANGAAAILGRSLTAGERDNFSTYMGLLVQWQRAHRLVGSADPMWIVEHLFLDSLLFLKVLPPRSGRWRTSAREPAFRVCPSRSCAGTSRLC